MTKISAMAVAKTAAQSALGHPHWAYEVKDCQGFVEWCWAENGYKVDFRGSNDMFRNIKGWLGSISAAQALGILLPGAVLYKWAQDDGEPDRYKADGKGNARHVGIYCGGVDGVDVAHSSTGGTQAGKLAGGWTHVHVPDFLDFGMTLPEGQTPPTTAPPISGTRPTLRKGDKGDYVRELQARLMDMLYALPKYGADGDFGTETVAAVKAFQADRGLVVDGIVGSATWAVLLSDSVIPGTPQEEPEGTGYMVAIFAYKGAPLTAEQSSNVMDEMRSAGYAVRREEVNG